VKETNVKEGIVSH